MKIFFRFQKYVAKSAWVHDSDPNDMQPNDTVFLNLYSHTCDLPPMDGDNAPSMLESDEIFPYATGYHTMSHHSF